MSSTTVRHILNAYRPSGHDNYDCGGGTRVTKQIP